MRVVRHRAASGLTVLQQVSQFTGDGIMAVFGAPVALEDHAVRACLAALGIQEEAKRLAAEVHDRDGIDLGLPRREADLEAALQLCAHCPALVLCRRWVNSLKPWERPVGVVAGTLLTPTRGSVPTGRRRGRPPKPRVST